MKEIYNLVGSCYNYQSSSPAIVLLVQSSISTFTELIVIINVKSHKFILGSRYV
ncbi:hypothetical protein L211DRAFT_547612 [Terfezia boudieri ATCC MYA-4762]|uniref:Uncharacterized protein n=1 Tax=Terfezia boudieri ATCC MYA-4762 TaxID=1051890 RepID=A0A3N4LX30_9PEZI|nr:hypothetical protein L211DRAFT_547612 [Terfezia boudieri ATCC MYA-4762]